MEPDGALWIHSWLDFGDDSIHGFDRDIRDDFVPAQPSLVSMPSLFGHPRR